MTMDSPEAIKQRIEAEIADSFDEELELELDDNRLESLLRDTSEQSPREVLDRHFYFKELFRLQRELVKLQDWVMNEKLKVVCRVAALPAPSERERGQWYFQRYISHLPARGEMALFDRSWYNRPGVERVMGFCSDSELEEFFQTVPDFEKMLIGSGIILLKYWFSITDEEQHLRFQMRIHDPIKQWKLSPMDLESRRRWENYTKAKEEMLERTHIQEAPWWVVEAVDKKKARLNCISHLLSAIPYGEVQHEPVSLPARVRNPDYIRAPVPRAMYVPPVY